LSLCSTNAGIFSTMPVVVAATSSPTTVWCKIDTVSGILPTDAKRCADSTNGYDDLSSQILMYFSKWKDRLCLL
jgi:hypothetical protein